MSKLGLPQRGTIARAKSHDHMGAIMAALMWGPKTMKQLMETTELPRITIRRVLLVLRWHGIAYVKDRSHHKTDKSGGWTYAFNSLPFEQADCELLYETREPRSKTVRKIKTKIKPTTGTCYDQPSPATQPKLSPATVRTDSGLSHRLL